jgi:hypothetical protein
MNFGALASGSSARQICATRLVTVTQASNAACAEGRV